MQIFKLRHEINKIPKTENGIYWFKLRFPRKDSLGITGSASEEEINKLVDVICQFGSLINNLSIKKSVTNKRGIMLMNTYAFTLSSSSNKGQRKYISRALKGKTHSDLDNLIEMLNLAVKEIPPLYVGITEKQSFRERFDQHFKTQTSFSEGLVETGIKWDWLSFTTCPQHEYKINDLKEVEKLFHYLLKPIFSKR
jgi:hypothetical protein